MNEPTQDILHKFLFEGETPPATVRGEIVSLTHAWRRMIEHHDYPSPVIHLLGEMVAASALLSANLKFDGALIMQIHGDGPVRLLVVECNADLSIRATAKLAPDVQIPDGASFQDLVNPGGGGRFAITLDPESKMPGQQPYQGIVPLDGASISDVLHEYMLRSQQLDTQLWLAADREVTAGLLLQKLPVSGGTSVAVSASAAEEKALEAAETWHRVITLANTLHASELLSTDPATLMRRLFHEETLRVFEPSKCIFRCTCSRERVGKMLLSLGQAEVDETIAEQGNVLVNCDFCNQRYEFDAVDCAQLFATGSVAEGTRKVSSSRH